MMPQLLNDEQYNTKLVMTPQKYPLYGLTNVAVSHKLGMTPQLLNGEQDNTKLAMSPQE
jgi:hypothetical protein